MIDIDRINSEIFSSLILIADDDAMIRLLVAGFLKKAGFTNIEFAENGAEALDAINSKSPACVILDIEMPLLNGNQVLRQIRSTPHTKDLPVVVITSHDAHEQRNNILRSGASDLISKPIDGYILIERVSNLLDRKNLLTQLTQFHDRLSVELSYATEMQTDMMPTSEELLSVENAYNVSLASHFSPSSELGGDAWFLQTIDEDRFGIMLVDFSGHGISAAVNTFRMHTIVSRLGVCYDSPAKYLAAINAEITKILPVDQYCTALYAMIDTKEDSLTYSAASAPAPIFGKIGDDLLVGDGKGLPLGVSPTAVYNDRLIGFPKGSCLFLYSDALLETQLGDKGPLEIEGVYSLANSLKNTDAHLAHNAILESFKNLAPTPLPDDLTTVWLSR